MCEGLSSTLKGTAKHLNLSPQKKKKKVKNETDKNRIGMIPLPLKKISQF